MKLNSKKELIPIVYGETAVKILSVCLDKNKEGFAEHWHERIELHLVKSGTLKLNCNGEEVIVKPGEVSIISPMFTHSGKVDGERVVYDVIMFSINDLYNETISTQQYLTSIIKGNICFKYKTDIPEIVTLVSDIVEMNINKQKYHPMETVGNLYRLLGLLFRHCIDDVHSSQLNTEKFDYVINYINNNFTEKISVDTISQKFNYEKSYFCRKFKNATGINASKYIRIQRLERARYFLEKTDMSIIEISASCGFSDNAYFINCFKKMYGISPLKYRKEHKA